MSALLVAAAIIATASSPRARKLEEKLIAPCCWSETVAKHSSEAAASIRREIETMIAKGKSDRTILDRFIAQYGSRILVEPEGRGRFIIYSIPALVLLTGLWVTIVVIRRMRAGSGAQSQTL